jgi:hypothetical protein
MKQSLSIFFTLLIFISFNSNVIGQENKLTIDSLPQEGVPKGTVTQHVYIRENPNISLFTKDSDLEVREIKSWKMKTIYQ